MYDGKDAHHFFGAHALKANELKNQGYFSRLVDLLAVAPLVGFHYGIRSDRDNAECKPANMLMAQILTVNVRLELNYKTIMLLDKEYEPDEETRFVKAFQVQPADRLAEDLERYESYTRGGVDFLFDHLIGEGNTQAERLEEMLDLVESFSERHYGSHPE